MAYKQQKCIPYSSKGWEVQDQGAGRFKDLVSSYFLRPWMAVFLLGPHMVEMASELPVVSFRRALLAFVRALCHVLISSGKPPPLNTISLGFQHINFRETQSIKTLYCDIYYKLMPILCVSVF